MILARCAPRALYVVGKSSYLLSLATERLCQLLSGSSPMGHMHIKVGSTRDVVVIARTLGRQLREVHGAVIKQELPPELQRVIDHLHEGAVKRPRG